MARTGFYSGSFDPVTLGHTDVIRRAAGLLDKLVIGIGVNPGKVAMFTTADRIALPASAGLGDAAQIFELLHQAGADTVLTFPLPGRSITLAGVDLDLLTPDSLLLLS